MKSNGNLRKAADSFGPEDTLHKATKLPPLKKSGKEKQSYYRELDDDEEDLDLKALHKRESVLDYFDDAEEDPDAEEWYDEDEEESGFEEDWDESDEDWEE